VVTGRVVVGKSGGTVTGVGAGEDDGGRVGVGAGDGAAVGVGAGEGTANSNEKLRLGATTRRGVVVVVDRLTLLPATFVFVFVFSLLLGSTSLISDGTIRGAGSTIGSVTLSGTGTAASRTGALTSGDGVDVAASATSPSFSAAACGPSSADTVMSEPTSPPSPITTMARLTTTAAVRTAVLNRCSGVDPAQVARPCSRFALIRRRQSPGIWSRSFK